MKRLSMLLLAGVLAAGVAGCEDTYYGERGYDYHRGYYDRDRYDYDRDDPRFRGHDSDYGDYGADWTWRGATRYCRDPEDRFVPCGVRR